uniref:Tc1-like transposase DDE domain-containing protein n=2 Tax=Pseudocrenilabrinae TaxID=318546 RepID=A0A3Q4HU26_NEOBR
MVVAQVGHLICITVLPFKCRPQFSEYVNLVFVLIHLHFLNMDFFQENNITILEHPACSPDLNPIENLCGWMAGEVCKNA